ncbi:MAG TPA: hypothetical protein VEC57_11135 [Candidatus Limnocylindrales bacterium]|nr:hypothetical protein [Candidatus Limnocylindrales bacterium]
MTRGAVERSLLAVLSELSKVVGQERVINAAGTVLQAAASTKQAVDENVAALLALANLPSRADVDDLRRQLDAMQVTLANLSRKVDRMLSEDSGEERARPRAARPRPPSHGPNHGPETREETVVADFDRD